MQLSGVSGSPQWVGAVLSWCFSALRPYASCWLAVVCKLN